MEKSLAFLGPQGTFTYQAALRFSEHYSPEYKYQLVPYPSIPAILDAVEDNKVDLGIVPIENSIEGGVNVALDMLTHDLNLYIQIEVVLDITHHLLTYMDSFQQINMVMSHPQALAQCRHFLETNLPHAAIIETNSTAEAVHAITLDKKGNAAIGSPDCHFRYNVPVKAENIGDYPHNQTRFFILGRSRNEPSIKNRKMDNNYINTGNNDNTQQDIQKTSLVVYPKGDRPGELFNILGMFLRYNINLSKVESRPVKRELGKYLFLIDCLADPLLLDDAINELNEITAGIKNLGSYQVLL